MKHWWMWLRYYTMSSQVQISNESVTWRNFSNGLDLLWTVFRNYVFGSLISISSRSLAEEPLEKLGWFRKKGREHFTRWRPYPNGTWLHVRVWLVFEKNEMFLFEGTEDGLQIFILHSKTVHNSTLSWITIQEIVPKCWKSFLDAIFRNISIWNNFKVEIY